METDVRSISLEGLRTWLSLQREKMSEGAGRLVWLTGERGEELGMQKRIPLGNVRRLRSNPDILWS